MADLKTDLAECVRLMERAKSRDKWTLNSTLSDACIHFIHDHGDELLAAVEDARRVSELEAILRVVRAMIRGRDMEYAVVDLDRRNVGLGAAIDAAMRVVAGNGGGDG